MSERSRVVYRRATSSDRKEILRVLEMVNFHHIPSEEMPELDVARFFIAESGGVVVGVAGYKVLGEGRGKTTLMAVDPSYRGLGIGRRLQELRMQELARAGCRTVTTNADLPQTIDWYIRNFGYKKVGTLAKLHEFGDPSIDQWTTLEANLVEWNNRRKDQA
jgi:N-acetylglutamate synthase-like GNAT family acetyltransferase